MPNFLLCEEGYFGLVVHHDDLWADTQLFSVYLFTLPHFKPFPLSGEFLYMPFL